MSLDRELLERCMHDFTVALAETPPDAPAHRQPYRDGRKRHAPLTKRDVLMEGIAAAADLLHSLVAVAEGEQQ